MKKELIAFALLSALTIHAQQPAVDPASGLPRSSSGNKAVIRGIRDGAPEISTDHGKTWKSAPAGNATGESAPATSPAAPAALPPPTFGVPAGQNIPTMNPYQASFQQRLNSVIATTGVTADPGETPVVFFEPMDQKKIDELTEDLQVLNLLLNRNLERAIGDKPFEVKLGVAMRMPMNARSVRVSYLQDYGVNIRVNVPFPLVAAPGEKTKKPEERATESEWEKARRAVHGGEFDPAEASNDAPVYNEELVSALKEEMFDALRNAKNLRHVKGGDWISLTVVGSSTYSSRRPSVLAMRFKKSAAEKASSAQELAKEAQINAYFDPATPPDAANSFRRIPRAGVSAGGGGIGR